MKSLKAIGVIVIPVLLALMFGNAIISILTHLKWIAGNMDTAPVMLACSFYSFFAFFAATANLMYKDTAKQQAPAIAIVHTQNTNPSWQI